MYKYYSDFTNHNVPQWLRDAKFGIYTHWGIYSVPAYGENVSWYPRRMYMDGEPQHEYHVKTYGTPDKFGYKDFIPMFTGEKFNAKEWVELFKKAGAKFVGPVGEHHDGFSMWDTKLNEWNSVNMGPKVNVVGEFERAARKAGLKFMVAMHHAENYFFFPRKPEYDTSKGYGLYGKDHDDIMDQWQQDFRKQQHPPKDVLDMWLNKTKEVIDLYAPDLLWFDFGLQNVQEHYKEELIAYYYNKEKEWGKEVTVTYKTHDLVVGSGLLDIELGRMGSLARHFWLTDTTIDAGEAWGYCKDATYKSPATLIHYLIDNVSKNGFLLLNVGPKPNGEIPEQAKDVLLEIGKWLELNGEAIYGTRAWLDYGEGNAVFTKAGNYGGFGEKDVPTYSQEDIRYTTKDDNLYAIVLAEPKGEILLKKTAYTLYPGEVVSVHLLGSEQPCEFEFIDHYGLKINVPEKLSSKYASAFRIKRKNPYR